MAKVSTSKALVALKAIRDTDKKEFPSTVGYRIARLKSKLEPIEAAYEAARQELIKSKYGTPSEKDANMLEVKQDKFQDFMVEIVELLKLEEEVEFTPINLSSLDGVELTSSFFQDMELFIVE